jgi:hypothetical protein
MKGVHISWGGPDRQITDATGKVWSFEDHPRCGPIVLNKRGDPDDKQPGQRSPFWHAWGCWNDQGKRLEGERCVWDEPAVCVVEHMAGRHYRVISGDPHAGGPVMLVNQGDEP